MIGRRDRRLGLLGSLLLQGALAACVRKDPPPAQPAAPLAADPEVTLGSMDAECDGLLSALADFQACPYHPDRARDGIEGWIETATRNLAAGRKANPEPNAQKAIAASCRKAADSVKAATARCQAGPAPQD